MNKIIVGIGLNYNSRESSEVFICLNKRMWYRLIDFDQRNGFSPIHLQSPDFKFFNL